MQYENSDFFGENEELMNVIILFFSYLLNADCISNFNLQFWGVRWYTEQIVSLYPFHLIEGFHLKA